MVGVPDAGPMGGVASAPRGRFLRVLITIDGAGPLDMVAAGHGAIPALLGGVGIPDVHVTHAGGPHPPIGAHLTLPPAQMGEPDRLADGWNPHRPRPGLVWPVRLALSLRWFLKCIHQRLNSLRPPVSLTLLGSGEWVGTQWG